MNSQRGNQLVKEQGNLVPGVSVIVPCRNEKDHIEACIQSLLAQKVPPDDFEVIVADGMSDDGTRKILSRLAKEEPRLRIVDNPSCTTATGLNAAIRMARGEIVIRMDAHSECASDYLVECLSVFRETGADNVGGAARTRVQGYLQSAIGEAFHSAFAVGGARFHNVGYEGYVDTVTYGCWFRDVLYQVGLFDEELMCNEDDEFNLRMIQAGLKIWQSPRIKSWYSPRHSLAGLFWQYWKYGYWKVRVLQKRKRPASIRHVIPGCFAFLLTFLLMVAPWWGPAWWGWLGLVFSYGACNIIASFLTAAKGSWRFLPLLPLIFACYHLSYGYGYLVGIWDFVILGRSGTTKKA